MQPSATPIAEVFALSQAGRTDEALELLDRLAAAGDPEAMFALGDLHWRGGLVARDYARARALFARASDAGHPAARRAHTNLLASGYGGVRDWSAAIRRLREEARDDRRRARMLALIEAMELTRDGDPVAAPDGQRISESPDLMLFPRLFTAAECAFLIEVAEPTFERSLVGYGEGDDQLNSHRTSDGSVMHCLIEDPVIHALNRRLAAASGSTVEQGEPLLILRYHPGQEFRRHVDALPGVRNQRVKTALVYLNQGFEGGETAFTRADLGIRARTGNAIIFGNLGPDGRADLMSEHAGLPVTRGVKYLASRWIRRDALF